MSYHTEVEFAFDEDRPPVREILARARPYLEDSDQGYSVEDVLEDLKRSLKKEKGDLKGLWSEDVEGLMEHISAGFPDVTFHVRGRGDELADLWLRVFRAGKILFKAGPFEDELGRALADES